MSDHEETFSYDKIPYGSYTFPLTHPDRLATLAMLHGLTPAKPESCRMLELGCGDGTNLLSMAYLMPGSNFVGIDLSEVHIESAKRGAASLGVSNVQFIQDDVTKIDLERLGNFDFISAHGLYSWVPDVVREAVLDIYAKCLDENGVGYISYNVYPGCYFRQMVWEIMRYFTADETDPRKLPERGRNIVSFISEAAKKDSPYQLVFKKELASVMRRPDENVYHDDFGPFNQPIYFHQFAEKIKSRGLQYLSEADPDTATVFNASAEVHSTIDNISAGDRIKREQYFDLIAGRKFRSTLICHEGLEVAEAPVADSLNKLLIATRLTPSEKSVPPEPLPEKFKGPNNEVIELNHPLAKAALHFLHERRPHAVAFDLVLENAAKTIGITLDQIKKSEIELFRKYLIDLFNVELIDLHAFQARFVSEVSGRPKVSDFAKFQIERECQGVTTMTGMNVIMPEPPLRILISLLDGTRNRDALIKGMFEQIKVPPNEKKSLRQQLPTMIEINLKKMAEIGLLVE